MQMTRRTRINLFLLLFSTISLQLFSDADSTTHNHLPHCELPGLIGEFPKEACIFMERFKKAADTCKKDRKKIEKHDNVLVIEGYEGSGKSAAAKAILSTARMHCIHLHDYDLMKNPDELQELLPKQEEPVMILFDDIDMFSPTGQKYVWYFINRYKDNPNVYFIVTTDWNTRSTAVHPKMHSKLYGHRMFIRPPDENQKRELLNHFSKQYTNKDLSEYCSEETLEKLISKTNNFSVRDLADICKYAQENANFQNKPISESDLVTQVYKIQDYKSSQERLAELREYAERNKVRVNA